MARTERYLLILALLLCVGSVGYPAAVAGVHNVDALRSVGERTFALAWERPLFRQLLAAFGATAGLALLLSLTSVVLRPAADRPKRGIAKRRPPPEAISLPRMPAPAIEPGELPLPQRGITRSGPLAIDPPTRERLALSPEAEGRLGELLRARNGLLLVVCRDRFIGTRAARVVSEIAGVAAKPLPIGDAATAEAAEATAMTGVALGVVTAPTAPRAVKMLEAWRPGLELSLLAVLQVAMVPNLCTDCIEARPIDADTEKRAREIGVDVLGRLMYTGSGCSTCAGTGFKGAQYVAVLADDAEAAQASLAAALLEWVGLSEVGIDDALSALEDA